MITKDSEVLDSTQLNYGIKKSIEFIEKLNFSNV